MTFNSKLFTVYTYCIYILVICLTIHQLAAISDNDNWRMIKCIMHYKPIHSRINLKFHVRPTHVIMFNLYLVGPVYYQSVRSCVSAFMRPFVRPSVWSSVRPSVRKFFSSSVHPSVRPFVRPFFCQSVHLSVTSIERFLVQFKRKVQALIQWGAARGERGAPRVQLWTKVELRDDHKLLVWESPRFQLCNMPPCLSSSLQPYSSSSPTRQKPRHRFLSPASDRPPLPPASSADQSNERAAACCPIYHGAENRKLRSLAHPCRGRH